MPFGLLTGLCAALAWGTLDVITALGSRVVGSLRVTAGMQLVTAVIFAGAGHRDRHGPADRPRDRSGWRSLLGMIGAGAYLSLLHRAPVSDRSRSSAGWSRRSAA